MTAMVLRGAAPMDEPNWPAALVAAPAAPRSEGTTPASAVLRVAGVATPVLIPSIRLAARTSGR